MIIVGVDPGTQRAGYAVIEAQRGQVKILRLGVWHLLSEARDHRLNDSESQVAKDLPAARPSMGCRLELLHENSRGLFTEFNPALIGLEKAVSFKNVSSALKLSEARGVIRLAAHQILSSADQRIKELSPTAVKRTAAGWGQSSKEGVLRILSLRFAGLNELKLDPKLTFDAFDALAIAWTVWVGWKNSPGLHDKRARVEQDAEP